MLTEFLRNTLLPKIPTKVLTFESLDPVSISDKTDDIAEIVLASKVRNGVVEVRSKHTTFGLFVNEITSNLKRDYIISSLKIPEDYRSTWFTENRIPWFLENGYIAPIPTDEYSHWCGENPFLPKDELDDDYNLARHLRAIKYTMLAITIPIQERDLALGRFQRLGGWEHDGRDGLGSSGNPKRIRELSVSIFPNGGIRLIG